ncbi:MAG: class I SAM-dependent rRNA methyltransferase [Holophagaceae bacterium]
MIDIDKPYPIVRLKKDKDSLMGKRHPWIFSGALQSIPHEPLVRIADSRGSVFAVGMTSSEGMSIAIRILSFQDIKIDENFFYTCLNKSILYRQLLGLFSINGGCRLVNAEGDGLPGLIIDQYSHVWVLQVTNSAIEKLRDLWLPAIYRIGSIYGASVFVERSNSGRKNENLQVVNSLLKGSLSGPIQILEGKARLSVPVMNGQKTGIFLDQAASRLKLNRLARSMDILNLFGYTGAFSVQAGLGGANHVTTVDISKFALDIAHKDWVTNNLDPNRHTIVESDAFEYVRNQSHSFGCVIVDPPAFAKQRKDIPKAFKAYKDIFRESSKLVRPGGLLWLFSCSHYLDIGRFQEAVWSALLESGREGLVFERLGANWDHPSSINHPEGTYLKGLLLGLR